VGEKVTRAIERAANKKIPLIVVAASGGARMQEGMFSLMQMAKTSAAVNKLSQNKIPYISILTHPTTGGVTASFATLADVIIAEPGALIGFTGPRVIEQTIKQKLPEGFQTAEFLLEHGMVDIVVERKKIKDEISKLLSLLTPEKKIKEVVRDLSAEAAKDASPKEVLEAVGDALKEEIGKRVQKIQNKLKKG
jgi:acetyl-CoA carboxylase carboxyl transferase subunit beta